MGNDIVRDEQATEILTEQPKQLTGQEQLYKSLEANREGLYQSAENLRQKFHDNWFSLSQIMKKTNVKNGVDARQLMNMLILSGLATNEERNREIKYKITISNRLRIVNLERQVAQLDEQKALVLAQIQQLQPPPVVEEAA